MCQFVTSYSGTTGYEAAHERYQWLQNYIREPENLNEKLAPLPRSVARLPSIIEAHAYTSTCVLVRARVVFPNINVMGMLS